ncbi:MAG TPA: endolytic transglycosylase MltG [Rhodocyclaceae bacterium]|nr:MAG: aminodeoxychorismate lyase [Betaproteobacteria bacterium CG2_30_68_42]PIX73898.1 MAG: endolytic transglycosylase MltG [Rhodocyclales bacterium CG_4_10_14_3_um_filter_68_10]PJA58606.1 MAG: endolytic transglycosylase MltG [Rhodocyclales bacterium CG_4_9_14_3_um_filter_68_10]HCX32250.1 endolytic transglycosylase MltG [Rhodocyclaceae bacterium]
MTRAFARILARFALFSLIPAALFAGWMAWFASAPIPLSFSPLEFRIKPGSGLRAAARELANAGLRIAPWQFELLGRVRGDSTRIKAGSYEVETGITPLGLLDKLTRGDVSQSEVLIVEGWNFRQMRAALDAAPGLAHDSTALSEREIIERIGATESSPEGIFFPDTYLFDRHASDLDILRRAHVQMRRTLDEEWAKRDPTVPYARPYQALIVASLVEKETGRAEDRPRIAAVFANRLRRGIPLQTDPSVIFGLGERFDGNLRRADLARDTAYNTYTRPGLPPTPIAIPGLASIQATLHPAQAEDLYFVARGDGSSEFSRTLDEHNRAVARYQKRR